MAAEWNTNVWSKRLQSELSALTNPTTSTTTSSNHHHHPNGEDTKEEVTADAVGSSNRSSSSSSSSRLLPPFVTVLDHIFDMDQGDCLVAFLIDLPTTKTTSTKTTTSSKSDQEVPSSPDPVEDIIVILDVSLPKQHKHSQDGVTTTTTTTVDPLAMSYPFVKPLAVLKSGSSRFPSHGDIRGIQNGDFLDIRIEEKEDWSPSFYLVDCISNISWEMKQSILQGLPYFAAAPVVPAATKKKIPQPEKKKRTERERIEESIREDFDQSYISMKQPPAARKQLSIEIGDEIQMLESPWKHISMGVYSCEVIRRPKKKKNLSSSVEIANTPLLSNQEEDADTFLMITENHIVEMRSNKHNVNSCLVTFVIPLEKLSKLTFRRSESLSLFWEDQEVEEEDGHHGVNVHLNSVVYMCPDSHDCVHLIQAGLKKQGVKSKQRTTMTPSAESAAIKQGLHLVSIVDKIELAFLQQHATTTNEENDNDIDNTTKHNNKTSKDPSNNSPNKNDEEQQVKDIMDLYRQAVDKFEMAGDYERQEEVFNRMYRFLALPLVICILDGSYFQKTKKKKGRWGKRGLWVREESSLSIASLPGCCSIS